MTNSLTSKTFGIIGGLGSLAGGDLFLKLIKTGPILADRGKYHFIFEQHPFKDLDIPLVKNVNLTSRKFYVYKTSSSFSEKGVDEILLPCFASHTFREELQSELNIRIIDMMDAVYRHTISQHADKRKLGILCSDFVRFSGLFEQYFHTDFELIYPDEVNQSAVMNAVYDTNGIKDGNLSGHTLEYIHQTCLHLEARGAQLIIPGITEIALLADDLHRRGVNMLDTNVIYANYATTEVTEVLPRPFKLGIVGGVGPAATVDFMSKVIRNTDAGRDQDHIKMVVEQNPQIPDRTANLINDETDPTIALYATCKRLECEEADAIAIPCNTAHAFVERLQPHLNVPIVNMLTETIQHIKDQYGTTEPIGLLATSGTIGSRVYHDIAEQLGVVLVTPDAENQLKVMDAIYGDRGVKAGYVTGQCVSDLMAAIEHLNQKGVSIFILGCTELPLMFVQQTHITVNGNQVLLIDPTEILAKKCVLLSKQANSH